MGQSFEKWWVGSVLRTLFAFALQLSWTRYDTLVWSLHKDQVSWHRVRTTKALRRLRGVPAVVRSEYVAATCSCFCCRARYVPELAAHPMRSWRTR
jgi:hypothetical protein